MIVFYPLSLLNLNAKRKRAFLNLEDARNQHWEVGTEITKLQMKEKEKQCNESYEKYRIALCEFIMRNI